MERMHSLIMLMLTFDVLHIETKAGFESSHVAVKDFSNLVSLFSQLTVSIVDTLSVTTNFGLLRQQCAV